MKGDGQEGIEGGGGEEQIYSHNYSLTCREFFHLLSMEFVNPNFALFQCVNGLYKPSPHSSANENHLFYFRFFGKILAKALCDGKHEVMECYLCICV